MKFLHATLIAAILPLSTLSLVAACASIPQASQTTTDERLALAVETGYQATAAGMRLAVESHAVKDPATIAHLRDLNRQAFTGVCRTRMAYNVVNHQPLGANLDGACAQVLTPADMTQAGDFQTEATAAIQLLGQLAQVIKGVN